MAASVTPTASFLPMCRSSTTFSKPRLAFQPLQCPKSFVSVSTVQPSSKVSAAPEVMESKTTDGQSVEILDSTAFEVGGREDVGASPIAIGEDADALCFGDDSYMPVHMNLSFSVDETLLSSQKVSSLKPSYSPQKDSTTIEHRVSIKNNHGETLVGILHETGSKDIAILCHGFRSSKESKTLVMLAAALTRKGVAAFCFDFSGNGESEGFFQYSNYWKDVDDLRAVILHILDQGRSKCYRRTQQRGKGIEERLGEGFCERIRKDGFIDVKSKSGKLLYRVTEHSLIDRLNTDMHASCSLISEKCRVLTVHGSADEIVPVEDAFGFSKLIPTHSLQIIEGADHRYCWHQAELVSSILEFIVEQH